jgi:hypothetical protein
MYKYLEAVASTQTKVSMYGHFVIFQNDKGVYVSCVKLYRRELGLRRLIRAQTSDSWRPTHDLTFTVPNSTVYSASLRWWTGSELTPLSTTPFFSRRWWSRIKLFWELNVHWRIYIYPLGPLISCINSSHTSTPFLLQNGRSVFSFYL